MGPPEVGQPGIETRLNLVSRRLLRLLGERGDADLAHLPAGWLARSRVVDRIEDSSGRLLVRLRRPFE